MARRVVITGLACVCPLGDQVESVWRRITGGQSGVGPITLFDARQFPVRIAAEVRDWDVERIPGMLEGLAKHARQTQFAVAAATSAWHHSGLSNTRLDPQRIGVYLGCGEVFPDLQRMGEFVAGSLSGEVHPAARKFQDAVQGPGDDWELRYEPGTAGGLIAGYLDAQGPTTNYTAACVSSSMALGEAAELIRRGGADIVVAGGAHSMIHPLGVTGFYRLATLSTRNDEPTRAARPFDMHRDGFVVGEGAAILVLEDRDHARRRDAPILAELTGYACTHDAWRITDPHPEARSATRCISAALARAGLTPADIDYINAHGSGTQANDKLETQAIKSAFGDRAYRVAVSSTKSMTGHLTTAGGALELLFCVLALRDQVAPPTINYETPDPQCDLDYVPNQARPIQCQHALSNSFGFGGQNVCLVVSRADHPNPKR